MNQRTLSSIALAILLGSTACTVHPPVEDPSSEPSFLPAAAAFVVAGEQLLAIDPGQSEPSPVLSSPLLQDVRALTRQPGTGDLFALTRGDDSPHLVVISHRDGTVREVGPLLLPRITVNVADALAFDETTGRLYAAGGVYHLSDLLMEIDPETAAARRISRITGTPQRELDALVFVQGQAFGLDIAIDSGTLVRLDRETGRATPLGSSFEAKMQDLAWSPGLAGLWGVTGEGVAALTLGGTLGVSPWSSGSDPAGAPWTAIAAVPDPKTIFADGFETGDASQWSQDRANP